MIRGMLRIRHLGGLALALVGGLVLALGAASSQAGTVRLLSDPRDSMLARRDAIESAKDEVLAQAFIFGDDNVTLATLALLRDAARRGACVKVLVDAHWNRIPGAVQAQLMHEGVQIREYHAFRIDRLYWVAQRMHEKLLVVDGRTLFAGGRNVESPYFGEGEEVGRRDYLDCDVAVDDPLASAAREYFMELWESGQVRKARRPTFPEDMERASRKLDEAEAWLDERLDAIRMQADDGRTEAVTVGSDALRFLADPVGRKGLDRGIAQDLHALLDTAQESIVIESPYLVPSRGVRRALRAARARGVRIRILTNSLGSTDNLWPQAALAGEKKRIVAWGVELWEYQGPECLHSKTAVLDGRTVVVGSFNLHPRSEKLDTEIAVVAESPELSRQLLDVMDSHLARARRIGADGRPEGAAERYPGVEGAKIARMRMLRLLVPFFRRQL